MRIYSRFLLLSVFAPSKRERINSKLIRSKNKIFFVEKNQTNCTNSIQFNFIFIKKDKRLNMLLT